MASSFELKLYLSTCRVQHVEVQLSVARWVNAKAWDPWIWWFEKKTCLEGRGKWSYEKQAKQLWG